MNVLIAKSIALILFKPTNAELFTLFYHFAEISKRTQTDATSRAWLKPFAKTSCAPQLATTIYTYTVH